MCISVLQQCHLFEGLSEEQIAGVLERTPYTRRIYRKNETVFRLMDPADHLGIVLEGRVQAQKIFSNGGQVNISLRRAGDLVGPAAAFSAAQRYPCEIVALERSELMLIRREDMIGLLQSYGQIMVNFLSELASATFMLQQRLELLSYNAINQKIAFYLMLHFMQTGRRRVPVPESMTKWALMMNVSRPSLHRELRKLEEDGLVRYDPPFIEILDEKSLQEML